MTDRDYILLGLGIPLLFIVVCYLVAFAGWRQVHQWYPDRPLGVTGADASWYMNWGLIGMANYKGVLTLTATPQGLRISVLFLFRIGHPPIFIPWGDITAVRETWYFSPVVLLTLAKVPSVPIRLSASTAQAIASHAGAAWAGIKDGA